MVDFPLSYPLSYLPRHWGWGLKVEIQLFSSTASTQPNTTKDICTETPCADPGIFCQGGGGVQAPQLILHFKEGVQWFYYTFSWGGGGPTFSRVGGPIETHITITCDLIGGGGGSVPPILTSGSAYGHCGILARIGSDEPVGPPFKLRNFKC